MEILFAGGASEVGASCSLLLVGGHTLLIDGGMRPAARDGQSRLPDISLLEQYPPEALIITHAHIDHTGALPLIASLYPSMPIYATESTRVLTEILLRDSVRIMEQEGLKPDGETPLYSLDQVDALLVRMQPIGFGQPFLPLPEVSNLLVRYLPAGHILGAAMIFLESPEGTLLHTGDISVTDQRTIKGLDVSSLPHADIMICEGTYGNRAHGQRKEEERKLVEKIQGVVARGGRVLCPAFAVGRSQEVVLILKAYRASNQLSPVPIFLDGMVRSVCMAYQQQSHDLHPRLQHFLSNARRPLFADPTLHVLAVRQEQRPALISQRTPKIIISSSGMLTGGASPLYAADMALQEQDCILFTGYQDEESPGAALLKAQQGDWLRLGGHVVALNCEMARYNLSGHADGDQIVQVVTHVAPHHLILVHGSPESLGTLAQRFPKIAVSIPTVGSQISIVVSKKAPLSPIPVVKQQQEPEQFHANSVPVQEQESLTPPSIETVWQRAFNDGPTRPWTAVELGQAVYGAFYRPAFRPLVERALKDASPYFQQGRVGAQATYLPRTQEAIEQLLPLTQLVPGEIVAVQGQQGQPQIALVLSPPQEGSVFCVADQWKPALRPMNVIKLVPGIVYPDLVKTSVEEARQYLQNWRGKLEEVWVDLIAWWEHCQGTPFSYQDLCQVVSSDNERLAWGIELLARGNMLFRREGIHWMPLDAQKIFQDRGLAHHLDLVHAGANARIVVNEQRGTLTGRQNWRFFEVQWEEGVHAGELAQVRGAHIQRAFEHDREK